MGICALAKLHENAPAELDEDKKERLRRELENVFLGNEGQEVAEEAVVQEGAAH